MDSHYEIKGTTVEVYSYIVFSTSYLNPMDYKEAIEKDLKRIGVKGKILFDLLLSHGNTPDRFFEVYFDGKEINEETLRSVEEITDSIKKFTYDFHRNRPHFIENSVLSNAQKFLLRKKT